MFHKDNNKLQSKDFLETKRKELQVVEEQAQRMRAMLLEHEAAEKKREEDEAKKKAEQARKRAEAARKDEQREKEKTNDPCDACRHHKAVCWWITERNSRAKSCLRCRGQRGKCTGGTAPVRAQACSRDSNAVVDSDIEEVAELPRKKTRTEEVEAGPSSLKDKRKNAEPEPENMKKRKRTEEKDQFSSFDTRDLFERLLREMCDTRAELRTLREELKEFRDIKDRLEAIQEYLAPKVEGLRRHRDGTLKVSKREENPM